VAISLVCAASLCAAGISSFAETQEHYSPYANQSYLLAVADRTDGMGMILDVLAGAANIMADPYGRELNAAFNKGGQAARDATVEMIRRFSQGEMNEALNYQPGNPA
jgi:hypothetical protein